MFKAIFCALPYGVCALTFFVFLGSVKLSTRARALTLMGLLACAAKFTCFAAFGGDAFAPELPRAMILVWNWAYSGLMLLCLFACLGWPIRLAVRRRWNKDCPRALWLAALPLLAWGLAARGVWNGVKLPEVREVTIASSAIPAELDGYRILQISDIHVSASAPRERTEALVARANAVGADLICLTGDLADGYSRHQFRNLAPLNGLAARDGVLAVTGNHEYYFDVIGWHVKRQKLDRIRFLANEHVEPRPGLVVAGVSDPQCLKWGFEAPNPDKAFAGAAEKGFRILLQHRPWIDYAHETGHVPAARWDLQLSGHTHGGVAPFVSWLVNGMNKGYCEGLYEGVRSRTDLLYVSSGAGHWAGFPIRFFDDPSMTVFTLRHAP